MRPRNSRLERQASALLSGRQVRGLVKQRDEFGIGIAEDDLRQKLIATARAKAIAKATLTYKAMPKDLRRDLNNRFKRERDAGASISWNDWLLREI